MKIFAAWISRHLSARLVYVTFWQKWVSYIFKMCNIVCTSCQYFVCIILKLTKILTQMWKGPYKICPQFPRKTGICAAWLFPCNTGICALSAFPCKTGICAHKYRVHSNRHSGSIPGTWGVHLLFRTHWDEQFGSKILKKAWKLRKLRTETQNIP